jgi:hypothetical protein
MGYCVEVGNTAPSSSAFSFTEYQFPDVLRGNGPRVLQVCIPTSIDSPARVSETTQAGTPLTEAALIVMGSADSRDPAKYLARRFPQFDPSRAGTATIVLSKPYTLEEMDRFLFLGRSTSGGQVQWVKVPADIDIQWQVRNRIRLYALRCQYIYTVPIDIVTFPIQLVIVNAKMARWAIKGN